MKRSVLKALFVLSFVFCAMFALSITSSAATYEPDGGTVTQYEYDSSECNRTIVVSCVDESGNLLKKVNIKTKYGADDLCFVSIYNYDPISFSSDQGLWETCKLMWTSGGMHCEGDIDIDYYFRTALSKKTINVTVRMRPFDQITIKEKHYKEQRIGTNGSIRNDILSDSKTTNLYCGDYFSTRAKSYTGYTLNSEYWSSLSGYWSMSMFGKPKNMGSVLSSMEWDIIDETWEMDGDDYPRWTEFDEDEDGILGHMENRVITIEYKYEVDWCTFTFNANGGTGAPSEKIEWWYNHDITIPSTVPTRTGYTFQGWGTYSTDTTPDYQPGQATTMGTTKTLYAIWKANTYTVSYNANGGSGAPSSQTKTHNVTLTLRTNTPTRSGYTFKGWSTSSSATSASYSAGGSFSTNANTTLYAVWQKNAATTYTVSYNANGGSGAPSSQTKTKDVTLTLSSTKPTRSGYTFLGWSTSSTATSPTYYAGGSYTANASATLYAVWSYNTPSPTPTTTYTISYNANGGSGAPSSQTKTKDVTLTLSSTKPTRSGYTFLGWSTSSTATSPTYYAGGSYTANASATLYAVWSYNAPTVYTITFNANGGSGAPSSVTKTDGVTIYLPSTEPTRTNYAFLGWSTSSTATSPTYYAGGSFTRNANTTLYAVWEYDPATYRVYYNANGGSGAPSSQTKTYGVSLTLSTTIPTRSGYDFLGWSTSSTATSATYDPGDTYTANASVTLYAVWDETNYDFSISNLTVSNSEPYKYDQITVKVRTDSWDQVNSYSDIPVQLYYDGRLVSTQYVDFSVYGVANITFTLNVGSSVGNKTIEARINWADHNSETRTGNNTISTSINVQDYDYEVTADPVSMAGYYCEGMEVISSFYVANNSDYDIIPSMHNTARFTAYYYNGSQRVVISTQDWDDVVIPAAGTNLVYFKWTVPTGLNGKTVYLDCTVNAYRHMNETNYDNNTASFSTTISTVANSQTPNTRFESEAPSSYQNVSAPAVSTDKATWTMWEYENGSFVLKRYGVQISSVSPVVAPSTDCVTAVYENGKWTMRSGYGITMSYAPTISTVSGYNRPDSNAYTSVQYAVATFPEFRYFDTNGNCRTLQYVNGSYQFVQNPDADGNARVHFIPVYVSDGNYTVSVKATHVWTPAGMIEATRSANVIIIGGTIYDDWYQG